MKVFFDLPALVTVFLRLFGAAVRFTEGMLGVSDGVADGIERLHHRYWFLCCDDTSRQDGWEQYRKGVNSHSRQVLDIPCHH